MSSYKLTYFNGKGLAEVSRLLFAAAGVAFEDARIDSPTFGALKPTLVYGQVPTLETAGATLAQSKAIERYLAKQFGLFGANDLEAAFIDGVGELVVDLRAKFNAAKDKDAEAKAKYFAEVLPGLLGFLEKALTSGGKALVGGSSISLGDIQLYYFLTTSFDAESLPLVQAAYAGLPTISGIVAAVAANPGIAAWVAGRATRGDAF